MCPAAGAAAPAITPRAARVIQRTGVIATELVDGVVTRCISCAPVEEEPMMRLSVRAGVALSLFVAACGGGDDPPTDPDASPGENWPPLFDPVPECEGAAIVPYAGERRVV